MTENPDVYRLFAPVCWGGGLLFLAWNAYVLLRRLPPERLKPFAGGVLIAVGTFLRWPDRLWVAWLALVDPTIWMLAYYAGVTTRNAWRMSRFHLLHAFEYRDARRRVRVKLFRRRIASISQRFHEGVQLRDFPDRSVDILWSVGSWEVTEGGFAVSGFDPRRALVLVDQPAQTCRVTETRTDEYPPDLDSLDGLELTRIA